MERAFKEIGDQVKDHMDGTNSSIFQLSTSNKDARKLANDLNGALQELHAERVFLKDGDKRMKENVTAISHDLRTPLTAINANVDLLELDGEKEELSDIRQQTERLTDLTNKLVFLSKMEEAEHTLQKIDMPLSDIVTEAANSFRAPALSRSLNYEIKVEPGITVNGSPDAVRQLLSVLLENAVKYTPDGGEIKLRLSSHRKTAVLTVANTINDNINDKDLQHIFDRFYRTDASRNSQTGGHGIGLSIAKAIVDAHGGNITASTKTGGEFIITATLPKL